jgi:hypothetical protein
MQIPTQAARPASHIASQSLQHPAIIGVHLRTPFTPAAALSGVPEITNTEEVIGSNPVSPTSTDRPLTSRNTAVSAFFTWCIARYVPDSRALSPHRSAWFASLAVPRASMPQEAPCPNHPV